MASVEARKAVGRVEDTLSVSSLLNSKKLFGQKLTKKQNLNLISD